MAQLKQHSTALKYVYIPVKAKFDDGGTDPTALSVEMAFVLVGNGLEAADWKAATWTPGNPGGQYRARCLVGPGGAVELIPGKYQPFVKFVDAPEIEIHEAPNTLLVT